MELFKTPPLLQDVTSLPNEGVVQQARRIHLREAKLISRFSLVSVIILCYSILFLVFSCASRLALIGAQDTRTLADEEAAEEAPLLTSCTSSQSGSTQSIEALGATSDDQAGTSQSAPEQPRTRRRSTDPSYDFSAIDGEEAPFVEGIKHFGSCQVQIGNVKLQVEAKEVVLLLPRHSCLGLSSLCEAEGCMSSISDGFFVKEEGPFGRKGRIQIVVDASFAESPNPLADLLEYGEDDETQGGPAGPSGSAASPQGLPQSSPQQTQQGSLQVPPWQSQPPRAAQEGSRADACMRAYVLLERTENRKALKHLFAAFHDMRRPHGHKRTERRLLDFGGLCAIVEIEEQEKRWGWPKIDAVNYAASRVEEKLIEALQQLDASSSGAFCYGHVKKSFGVEEYVESGRAGAALFSIRVRTVESRLTDAATSAAVAIASPQGLDSPTIQAPSESQTEEVPKDLPHLGAYGPADPSKKGGFF
ncbi:hypothetical protein Esti_005911 [Eimeria stiedai]